MASNTNYLSLGKLCVFLILKYVTKHIECDTEQFRPSIQLPRITFAVTIVCKMVAAAMQCNSAQADCGMNGQDDIRDSDYHCGGDL